MQDRKRIVREREYEDKVLYETGKLFNGIEVQDSILSSCHERGMERRRAPILSPGGKNDIEIASCDLLTLSSTK